jgi:hypothetical protein
LVLFLAKAVRDLPELVNYSAMVGRSLPLSVMGLPVLDTNFCCNGFAFRRAWSIWMLEVVKRMAFCN